MFWLHKIALNQTRLDYDIISFKRYPGNIEWNLEKIWNSLSKSLERIFSSTSSTMYDRLNSFKYGFKQFKQNSVQNLPNRS